MLRWGSAFLFLISLSACSVYKSSVRREFESTSSGRVQLNSFWGSCHKVTRLQSWLQTEFPHQSGEILFSEADREAFLFANDEGLLTLQVDRHDEVQGDEVCTRSFANVDEWNAFAPELEKAWHSFQKSSETPD